MNESSSWIRRFGVVPEDPGFIYVFGSGNRYKIGRSKNKSARLKAAKTWLPDVKVVGIKPFWNVADVEKNLHEGFARCWYHGEWFRLLDEGYRDTLIEGFCEFSDTDRDRNSVDFIYWFNSDGMAEFVRERNEQGLSLRQFLHQESEAKKKK